MSDVCSTHRFNYSQYVCSFDHILPVAGPSARSIQDLVAQLENMRFVTTNLIVKEGIPNVFHHSRYSLNIILTLFIPHNVHTIVERAPTISDKPESAMGEGKYNYRLE